MYKVEIMIITIDGPAGTGKTTIARSIAGKLKFSYFDTGAMYRILTYQIGKKSVDLHDQERLSALLEAFKFDVQDVDQEKRYFLEGEDVTELIRTPQITQRVSRVAAHPEVRRAVLSIQREFGRGKNAVFEGRDMGTVVFPKAELKIFLTARPAVRAERRYQEFKKKGVLTERETVLQEILERDHLDSTRQISPLKQAEDAHLIDTSDLTIEQVLYQILRYVNSVGL
jgi:cytidylate kinase